MKDVKAALFDLDGTLFDTEGQYTELWGAIGRKYRPDIPDLAIRIKGTTLKQIFATYFQEAEVQKQVKADLDAGELTMKYSFFPGALDFIKDLQSHGVKCAIVTSSNQAKMASVLKQIPEFNTLFDRILTSEDFSASKPHPDCYLLGAKVFGLTPADCVVFEDAFTGLQAGMAAGMFTIGLTTCNSRAAIQDKCSYVLDGFEDLNYGKLIEIINN